MTAIIELYANNAYSSLSAVLTDTATTINLDSGTGARFPTPVVGKQFFRLVLTSASSPNTIFEIVYCTQRVSDVLTVLRGQEGTTAQAWAIGDLLGNEPTAGMFNQFVQPSFGQDTGNPNIYVVSTPQHDSALYNGMPVTFTTLNANTAPNPFLNLNELGFKQIVMPGGGQILPGMIAANIPITCVFSTADDAWHLITNVNVPLIQIAGGNATTGGTDISFPKEFPNAILQCQLTVLTSSSESLASNGFVGYQIINKQTIRAFSVIGSPAVSVLGIGY